MSEKTGWGGHTGHRRKLLGRWVHLVLAGLQPMPVTKLPRPSPPYNGMGEPDQGRCYWTGCDGYEKRPGRLVHAHPCLCQAWCARSTPLPFSSQHTSTHRQRRCLTPRPQEKKKKKPHGITAPPPLLQTPARTAGRSQHAPHPPLPGAHSRSSLQRPINILSGPALSCPTPPASQIALSHQKSLHLCPGPQTPPPQSTYPYPATATVYTTTTTKARTHAHSQPTPTTRPSCSHHHHLYLDTDCSSTSPISEHMTSFSPGCPAL